MRYRIVQRLLLSAVLFAGWVVSLNAIAKWGPYRGVTVSELDEQMAAVLSNVGVNLVRFSFNKRPLMYKTPPYGFNEASFARLDRAIDLCEQYGLKIVIDPHTAPGFEKNNTAQARDPFWTSYSWHDKLIALWDRISRRYAGRGDVIAGYELINEPSVPRSADGRPKGGPADYNELVRKLVATIRSNDATRPIIVQVVPGRRKGPNRIYPLDGPQYLELPDDPHLVISIHMYEPSAFSHQGVGVWPDGVPYPGDAGGRYWDKETLDQVMQPIRDLEQRLGRDVYVGEFSAVRWSGRSGNRYLQDLLDLFEYYGWSWTYHIFRGSQVWDAELSNTDRDDAGTRGLTPRTDLLLRYFDRNRCDVP